MNMYVIKNGQQQGPLSEAEVHNRMNSGELSGNDLGWHEGLAGWLPLSQIMPSISLFSSSPATVKSSGIAKTSFILALSTFGIWFFLIVLYVQTRSFRNVDEIIGLIIFMIFVCVVGNITGIVFGIIGATKTISNKWMAIIGMIVNTIGFLGLAVLFSD